MPRGFAILNVTDLNSMTMADAISAMEEGRVTPEALASIQKACSLCEQRQIAKASTVDAWPADLAPSPRDCSNPKNVSVLIRQGAAHGHL